MQAEETGWVESRGTAIVHGEDLRQTSEIQRKRHCPGPLKLTKEEQVDLEAKMAGPVHSVLSPLPMEALADDGFWRYLALFPYRWYLLAREPELKSGDFGGLGTSEDETGTVHAKGVFNRNQVMLRTYLWGRAAFDLNDPKASAENPYRRANLVLGVEKISRTDVWHSHMTRVELGYLGEIPHAFIDELVSYKQDGADPVGMDIHDARQLAKLTTRMKHNLMLDVLEYEEAKSVVHHLVPQARMKGSEKRTEVELKKSEKKSATDVAKSSRKSKKKSQKDMIK